MVENLPLILTGLSITASITYYALVLRNQNKTRQAQMFLNWYDKITSLEGIEQARILRENTWATYEEWLDLYQNSVDYRRAFSWWLTATEGVGVLLKEGLVDIRLLALFLTGPTLDYWKYFGPIIQKERERRYPTLGSEFEYTVNELKKYLKENPNIHG